MSTAFLSLSACLCVLSTCPRLNRPSPPLIFPCPFPVTFSPLLPCPSSLRSLYTCSALAGAATADSAATTVIIRVPPSLVLAQGPGRVVLLGYSRSAQRSRGHASQSDALSSFLSAPFSSMLGPPLSALTKPSHLARGWRLHAIVVATLQRVSRMPRPRRRR